MWETRRFQQTKSVSVDCRGAQGFTKPCSMVIYLGVGVASQFFGHGANACHSHHADRHEQWMPRKETPTGGRWLRCGHVSTSQRKGNQGSQQQTVISCRHGWGLHIYIYVRAAAGSRFCPKQQQREETIIPTTNLVRFNDRGVIEVGRPAGRILVTDLPCIFPELPSSPCLYYFFAWDKDVGFRR